MKTLLTISTLVFTLMFSSTSFAEWTKVTEDKNGTTFYVDNERIRKVDGFIYYWQMSNYLNPDLDGGVSYKIYYQGDCKLFRKKRLNYSSYKEPMGEGTAYESSNKPNKDWSYHPPNYGAEVILKSVCSR